MEPAAPLQVALQVAAALERCGVRYLVGGSLASSVSGEPRATMDVDLVVALTQADVEPFLAHLGEGFYADEETLRSAIRARSSVNLIHIESSTKVVLFILGGTPVDDEQMERRVKMQVASGPDRYLYSSKWSTELRSSGVKSFANIDSNRVGQPKVYQSLLEVGLEVCSEL